jgi:hypothetical protein
MNDDELRTSQNATIASSQSVAFDGYHTPPLLRMYFEARRKALLIELRAVEEWLDMPSSLTTARERRRLNREVDQLTDT